MFCSKCGNQVSDSAIFCNKCGTQVKKSGNLNVESQSTRPIQSKEKEKKTKKQKFERQGKVSANILAIASLLSLVASIVIYIFAWVSIFNDPAATVSGWLWVILNGVCSVVLLMMFSATIVNSANLVHKRIITLICAIFVLNCLLAIGISVLNVINRVQFWVKAQTSDNAFVGGGFEIAILKDCLAIIFSVVVIVACILTVYAIKKQKKRLAKILLVFFAVYIIYVLAPLLEMQVMIWEYGVFTCFRIISTKLEAVSMYLFMSWLLVKSKQQEKKLL